MFPPRTFWLNISGNVAITFSLALVPVLVATGSAVDMIRANVLRTTLQTAADAAALAGGASSKMTDGAMTTFAKDFLEANGAGDAASKVKATKITKDQKTGNFIVQIDAALETSFMAVAGIRTMDIRVKSEVTLGTGGPLEMVLALDTTASMGSNGKISTLKTAATDLVNKVMSGGNVKVGVAPFADYFKVGTKYAGEPWLDVPAPETREYCNYSYPNKTQCSIATGTCYNDGIPLPCTGEVCKDWGEPVGSCKLYTYKWTGCVGARPEAYHASISDATSFPYPGRVWDCGTAMQALTDVRTDVLATIDALYPSGNTHIPSGLLWAWNMLTPEAPLTEAMSAADVKAKGGKKVMVLMTDGANSSSPVNGDYAADVNTKYGTNAYTNGLTTKLCDSIKAEGTIVYTVLFEVSDPSIEALLRGCASDPSKSYVAGDKSALLVAFSDIGTSLTKLRLTR
jgi:Flp pilus assembly protein TadG